MIGRLVDCEKVGGKLGFPLSDRLMMEAIWSVIVWILARYI